MDSLHSLLFLACIYLLLRIIYWLLRITRIRQSTYVHPAVCHPWALVRFLLPRRYQSLHSDWQLQRRKYTWYSDSRVMRIVSLFGLDTVYVANPEAILEISTNPARYPKAVELYGTPPRPFQGYRMPELMG